MPRRRKELEAFFRALAEKQKAEAVKPTSPKRRRWSSATPTFCSGGHKHPSKMEARVCDRLTLEVAGNWREREQLFRQVRLPLLNIAPDAGDKPLYFSVDFAITRGGKLHRLIDAKAKGRVSRDWRRGKAACEACWGIKVEEVDR